MKLELQQEPYRTTVDVSHVFKKHLDMQRGPTKQEIEAEERRMFLKDAAAVLDKYGIYYIVKGSLKSSIRQPERDPRFINGFRPRR